MLRRPPSASQCSNSCALSRAIAAASERHAERAQAQCGLRAAAMGDAVPAERGRGLSVLGVVVDEDAMLGLLLRMLQQMRVDARIRLHRSEERRVGKECRSRWSAYRQKKRQE